MHIVFRLFVYSTKIEQSHKTHHEDLRTWKLSDDTSSLRFSASNCSILVHIQYLITYKNINKERRWIQRSLWWWVNLPRGLCGWMPQLWNTFSLKIKPYKPAQKTANRDGFMVWNLAKWKVAERYKSNVAKVHYANVYLNFLLGVVDTRLQQSKCL